MYKKQCEEDQQINKHFIKLFRRSLQDILIDKNEHKTLCYVLNEYVAEKKNDPFLWEWKLKQNFILLVIIKWNLN